MPVYSRRCFSQEGLTYSSKGDLVVLTLGPLFETVPYTTFSEFSREVIFKIISRAQIGQKLI